MSATLFTPETLPPVLDCEMIAGDIDYQERGQCGACPVARMLQRLFPLASDHWSVGWGEAAIYNFFDEEVATFELDANAVSFVARFDRGLPVQPGTFRFRRAGA